MLLLIFVIAFGLPARSKSEQECYERMNSRQQREGDDEEAVPSQPQFKVLMSSLLRPQVLFWLFEVSLVGAGMAVVDSFLFVFLQNELQASTELCGYTVGVTVLWELPIFHFSKELLSWLGHDVLFFLAMIAYTTRVIGYTLLSPSSAHWVLALEVTHGITFACMWISSIDYSALVAPKEWSTTFQSILQTALTCVGGGLGPVIAGFVMDNYGPFIMFRGVGILVGLVLLLHITMVFIFNQGHDKFLAQIEAERQEQAENQSNESGRNLLTVESEDETTTPTEELS